MQTICNVAKTRKIAPAGMPMICFRMDCFCVRVRGAALSARMGVTVWHSIVEDGEDAGHAGTPMEDDGAAPGTV